MWRAYRRLDWSVLSSKQSSDKNNNRYPIYYLLISPPWHSAYTDKHEMERTRRIVLNCKLLDEVALWPRVCPFGRSTLFFPLFHCMDGRTSHARDRGT